MLSYSGPVGSLRFNQRGLGLRVTSCGLRVASCELRVAGCELRVTGCGLRVTGCGLRVAKSVFPNVVLSSVLCFLLSVLCYTFTNICLGVIFVSIRDGREEGIPTFPPGRRPIGAKPLILTLGAGNGVYKNTTIR